MPDPEARPDPLVSDAAVVEWYRVDVRKRISRVLALASLPVVLGSLVLASNLLSRDVEDPSHRFRRAHLTGDLVDPQGRPTPRGDTGDLWVFAFGMVLVASGPAIAIAGLRRVMGVEHFLLLRTDGLLHAEGERYLLVEWDDVEEVGFDDERGAVALLLRSGEVIHLTAEFAGVTPRSLAKRLEAVRRKAVWQLLPQQRG